MSHPGGESPTRWRRYWRLVRRDVAAEVDEELAFHIHMRSERNMALGMEPGDARRDALSRFGDPALVRDALVEHDTRQSRVEDRREYMADLLQDIRFGWRALRRAPGFTVAAALTLALCIGANAAIYSVVNAVLLRPLPYARPHELVTIGQGSAGEFVALRERLRRFADLALYVSTTHNIGDGERPERIEGASITGNLFPLLGVTPLFGRGFTEEESIRGNNTSIVLSYGLWQEKFGGDPAVLGKQLTIEGIPITVVGVMPQEFRFPDRHTRYWIPFAFHPGNASRTWAVGGKTFIGRLAAGVTVEQAAREVAEVFPTLRTLNPVWDPGPEYRRNASATPLHTDIVGSSRTVLWVLFGCVQLVLLVGCVNVANLLLARVTARERELAIRVALGGGRGRLVRQLVTESLLLAAIGAALGVAVAAAMVRVLVAVMPATMPLAGEIALDGSVLLYTAVLATVTGVLFGIIPALRATRSAVKRDVTLGRRATAGAHHQRVAATLVTLEVALAVLLAVGSVLLVRSFWMLRSEDPGFRPSGVIAARVTPPNADYRDPARLAALYDGILQRMAALPGVEHVAAVNRLPFAQRVPGTEVRVQGQWEDDTRPLPELGHFQEITPAYFESMGIPLLQGRAFTGADRADQPPVTIISQSVAEKFWPGENPVGKRLGYPWPSAWLTVVGVVPDVKQDSIRDTTSTSMYVPWQQRTRMSKWEMWVLARTSGRPEALAGPVREIVRAVAPTVAVSQVQTMDAVLAGSMERARFTMLLVACFAGAAILLGAVGIYGVMAYLVAQRAREMGIRMALGARPADVRALVLNRALALTLAGTAFGVLAAILAGRWLRSLLYDVTVADPLTLVAVPLGFLAVAVAASLIPAHRATRVDPGSALRAE